MPLPLPALSKACVKSIDVTSLKADELPSPNGLMEIVRSLPRARRARVEMIGPRSIRGTWAGTFRVRGEPIKGRGAAEFVFDLPDVGGRTRPVASSGSSCPFYAHGGAA